MVDKTKKKYNDPYSGGGFRDYVTDNYIQGIYFNKSKKEKELLSNKLTKYNIQFTKQVNELNKEFYGLILVYSIAITMIKEHEEYEYGDVRPLYRLLHAQGGTVRFNRVLKTALRKYAVNSQEVYNTIKKGLDSQEDRVNRNKQLILDTFKNFGMNSLTDIVKQDTQLDIFEHIIQFVENEKENTMILSDEDEDKFFEQAKLKYIQWLKDLAHKYNISIYDSISESMIKDKERRKRISEEINTQKKLNKEQDKKNRAYDLMDRDSIKIQNDIDKAVNIIENQLHGSRFGYMSLKRLISKLSDHKSKVHYIACSKNTSIRYVTETYNTTTSLVNAKLFDSADIANNVLKHIMKRSENEDTYFKVESIRYAEPLKHSKVYKVDIVNYIKSLLCAMDDVDSPIIAMRFIYGANGFYQPKSYGDAFIYQNAIKQSEILCESDGKLYSSEDYSKIYVLACTDIKAKANIEVNNQIFIRRKVDFNCQWYKDRSLEAIRFNKFISAMVNGEAIPIMCKDFGFNNYDIDTHKYGQEIIKRIQSRLKNKQYSDNYFIMKFRIGNRHGNMYVQSLRNFKYIRLKNTTGECESLVTADIFSSYEDAVKTLEELYRKDEKSLYIIGSLDYASCK